MFDLARAARRDHRKAHRARHRAREFDVVTVARAVAVHTRQQDLTGAESFRAHGPLDRVPTDVTATAVRINFPTALRATTCVDLHDHTLTPKSLSTRFDQLRIFDGGGV